MNLPALHGNWVDLIIIAFVVFYVWDNWGKGFLSFFLELMSFVIAFMLAFKFYPIAADILVDHFSFPHGLAKAAGFFVLGIVFEQIIVHIADRIENKVPSQIQRHKLNKYLTVIPLVANAIIIVAFILILTLGLPIPTPIKRAVSESKFAAPMLSQAHRVERAISGVFGEALNDTFNFITTGPIGEREHVKLNFNQRELTIDTNSEAQMLVLVNQERALQGLSTLVSDDKLRDLARAYAKDMFERGYFSHYSPEGTSPFERMEAVGIEYETAGENLALAPNVSIAHDGLMDSPGHRENILNLDFGKVGIGVIDGGIYGKMFVQEFTD